MYSLEACRPSNVVVVVVVVVVLLLALSLSLFCRCRFHRLVGTLSASPYWIIQFCTICQIVAAWKSHSVFFFPNYLVREVDIPGTIFAVSLYATREILSYVRVVESCPLI